MVKIENNKDYKRILKNSNTGKSDSKSKQKIVENSH